jgi:hypothetical protein
MDKLDTYVRGLSALGKAETSYQELLVPMPLDKIHTDVRKQKTCTCGKNEFTLQELRDVIRKEICAMEAGDSTQDYYSTSSLDYTSPFSNATNATVACKKEY